MSEVPQHVKDLAHEAARWRAIVATQASMNTPTDPVERIKANAEYRMTLDQMIFAEQRAQSAMDQWLRSSPSHKGAA